MPPSSPEYSSHEIQASPGFIHVSPGFIRVSPGQGQLCHVGQSLGITRNPRIWRLFQPEVPSRSPRRRQGRAGMTNLQCPGHLQPPQTSQNCRAGIEKSSSISGIHGYTSRTFLHQRCIFWGKNSQTLLVLLHQGWSCETDTKHFPKEANPGQMGADLGDCSRIRIPGNKSHPGATRRGSHNLESSPKPSARADLPTDF